jgi:EPS-associated MarR family transcriptional regulator
MKLNEELFETLRSIYRNPSVSQRKLAEKLGFSLGKMNYCISALKEKGYIKLNNFKKNQNKVRYAYILTPKGISEKTNLTINFMKKKMHEYDELKKDLKK